MEERLTQLYESVGFRDLVEIAILALSIYAILRFLGKTRGSGIVRGLALVVMGLFLVAQVIIASLDLTELGKILDYLLSTVVVGLLVIFQPELRRGLMVLGRYRMFRYLVSSSDPISQQLAEAAEGLSRDCMGGLIAIQCEMPLASYIETGQRIDGEVSSALLRTIFTPPSPLHDGAVIVANGRLVAAGCQLPLSQPHDGTGPHMGMRHRAALTLSEETDAILLVVSEETGRISIAVGGKLEVVSRDTLRRRLETMLSRSAEPARGLRKVA